MADRRSEVESFGEKLNLMWCSPVDSQPGEENQAYITHMTAGQQSNILVTGEATGDIRVYNLQGFQPVGTINRYNAKPINSLSISKSNENVFWASAAATEISCWDLRTNFQRPVHTLTSPNNCNYTCSDVNSTGGMIAAATEPDAEDVPIYIWDLRNSDKPQDSEHSSFYSGMFSDSHKDDITQVKFHPTKSKDLASCSTDGLICLFDLSHQEEDDALQWVLNSQSSVARIGYYGLDFDKLYCLTHIETLQLWDAEQALILADHADIRDHRTTSEPVEYLVDCSYHPSHDRLLLFGGQNNGNFQVFDVRKDRVHRSFSSPCGHSATVRCLEYHAKSDLVITGGEDSAVCYWRLPELSEQVKPVTREARKDMSKDHSNDHSKIISVRDRTRTKPYDKRK